MIPWEEFTDEDGDDVRDGGDDDGDGGDDDDDAPQPALKPSVFAIIMKTIIIIISYDIMISLYNANIKIILIFMGPMI